MPSLWGMLTGAAPAKSPEQLEVERSFAPDELQVTRSQFQSALAQQQHSGASSGQGAGLREQAFVVTLCGLRQVEPSLSTALFTAASRGQPTVSEVDVLRLKAALERQGEETAQDTAFKLLSSNPGAGSTVPLLTLKTRIAAAVHLWFQAVSPGGSSSNNSNSLGIPGLSSSLSGEAFDRQVEAVARGSLGSSGSGSGSEELTRDGYAKWCKTCPALQQVLSRLLSRVGDTGSSGRTISATASSTKSGGATAVPGQSGSAASSGPAVQGPTFLPLPTFAQAAAYSMAECLLQPVYMWALCSMLAPDLRSEWRPLFSSSRDGKSFQTLIGRCAAAPGPTLVLVRDMEGHLFGGFASLPWEKHGTFYGDFTSFIFSLEPFVQIYPASGINTNFQWCGVGFKELPSGIGFGGAAGDKNLGAFALYLDSTLDAGQSRPIATYANPPLAGESQRFQVSSVECWLLKPPDEDELLFQQGGRKGGSALDKAKEDQAIMEHMGKGMHSHGLRGGGRPEDDL